MSEWSIYHTLLLLCALIVKFVLPLVLCGTALCMPYLPIDRQLGGSKALFPQSPPSLLSTKIRS